VSVEDLQSVKGLGVQGVLQAERLVTGHDGLDAVDGWVEVRDGIVVAIGEGATPTGSPVTRVAGTIVPGFVDIHAHGAVGNDFSRADAPGIRAAAAHHASTGTTTIVASVASGTTEATGEAIDRLRELVSDGTLAGIHLEGPYLSQARRGAHNPDVLRAPDLAELAGFIDRARGTLRCVTMAPELPGAEAAIRLLAERGVVAAIGHTDCSAEIAHAAFGWGATHATHLYNGMPELLHRAPGPVGAALVDRTATVELILDGVHLAPEAAKVAVRSAAGRIVLVSDAMEATGQPDGDYAIAGSDVVVHGGVATLADGSSLAGSTRVIAECVGALLAFEGVSLLDAVRATSVTPAHAMRLPFAGLEVGAPADLLVVDTVPRFRVRQVLRRGEWLASSS
jgi:N-acetylglucosamine-6-phosphate deacetylase